MQAGIMGLLAACDVGLHCEACIVGLGCTAEVQRLQKQTDTLKETMDTTQCQLDEASSGKDAASAAFRAISRKLKPAQKSVVLLHCASSLANTAHSVQMVKHACRLRTLH